MQPKAPHPEHQGHCRGAAPGSHHEDADREGDVVAPGDAQHVGQVQREVDDATACRGQVGTGEEGADEEALADGGHREGAEEEEDDCWVAVGQDVSQLRMEAGWSLWSPPCWLPALVFPVSPTLSPETCNLP